MEIIKKIKDRIKRSNDPLGKWYQITFDNKSVTISAQPPGKESWTQSFNWADIIRVVFKGEGGLVSDGIYVFTSKRPESYVIPTESSGGEKFVNELIERKYFSSDKFTEAVLTPYGIYCWPDDEKDTKWQKKS